MTEPQLPKYIVLEWDTEIDYWRLTAVADSETEALEKRDHWTAKGCVNLHVLSTTEVPNDDNN